MELARGTFTVRNRLGLHARAATRLVETATRFPCDVLISRDGQTANAKSVMGVLLLCGCPGSQLEIEARGPQATQAVTEIGALIDDRFGEGE
jgi:phosphocarrier protein HPr